MADLLGVLGMLLLAGGLVLATIGLYGMLRKPDIFDQLHAASLLTGPGVILVLLASIGTGRAETITSAVLVIAFVLVTASLATHVIGDAAWRRSHVPAGSTEEQRRAPGTAPTPGTPGRPGRRFELAGAGRASPMRVVLAHDGSPGARTAAELAEALPWPTGTRILVVGVVDADLPPLAADAAQTGRRSLEEAGRELDGLLEEEAGRLGREEVAVEWRRGQGDPADAVVDAAHAFRADLVITGSRGLGLRSLVVGSVASEIVDRSSCPVLVARSGRMRGIVLSTDGSAASVPAVEVVATWPIFDGVSVRVLSVGSDDGDDADGAGMEPQDEIAASVAAQLSALGREAVAEARVGDPAGQIVEAAGEGDLIVMGSRGRTGLTRTLLGSVARSVLFSATTSVLVVRRDAAEPTPDA